MGLQRGSTVGRVYKGGALSHGFTEGVTIVTNDELSGAHYVKNGGIGHFSWVFCWWFSKKCLSLHCVKDKRAT